jgi:hypothetical protein
MPFDDVRDDDNGADWQPNFSVHTPLAEVLELAAIAADRAFAESLEILARDDVTLKPELREWLEAFTQTQTRAAFLSGYARLKREAAHEADSAQEN